MLPKLRLLARRSTFKMNLASIFTTRGYLIRRALWKEINKFGLSAQGNLLDFGCGSKPYQSAFLSCNSYIGIDVEITGHNHRNSLVDVFFNGSVIPFNNAHFDIAIAIEVFEHLSEPSKAITEIQRVLRPNGLLFLSIPFIYGEHEMPHDFQRFTLMGLKTLVEENQFQIIELKKLNDNLGTIGQLFIDNFIYKNRYSNHLIWKAFTTLLIFPANCLIMSMSIFKSKDSQVYSNLICIAKKI